MPLHQETYDIFHEYYPPQTLAEAPQSLRSHHTDAQDSYAQQSASAFVHQHPSPVQTTNFPTFYMPSTSRNSGGGTASTSGGDLQTLAAQISSQVYQHNAQISHQYGNYWAYNINKNSQHHGC